MQKLRHTCAALAIASTAALASTATLAAGGSGDETTRSTTLASSASAAGAKTQPSVADARPAPFASAPLTAAALAAKRGGDRVANDTQLTGSVTGNQANNISTGANGLGGGAFSGSSGITTVIQNTGNNVLIQNSTVVNVQFK